MGDADYCHATDGIGGSERTAAWRQDGPRGRRAARTSGSPIHRRPPPTLTISRVVGDRPSALTPSRVTSCSRARRVDRQARDAGLTARSRHLLRNKSSPERQAGCVRGFSLYPSIPRTFRQARLAGRSSPAVDRQIDAENRPSTFRAFAHLWNAEDFRWSQKRARSKARKEVDLANGPWIFQPQL